MFSWQGRGAKAIRNAKHFFKPLHASSLPTSHWPKQGTWPSPEAGWEGSGRLQSWAWTLEGQALRFLLHPSTRRRKSNLQYIPSTAASLAFQLWWNSQSYLSLISSFWFINVFPLGHAKRSKQTISEGWYFGRLLTLFIVNKEERLLCPLLQLTTCRRDGFIWENVIQYGKGHYKRCSGKIIFFLICRAWYCQCGLQVALTDNWPLPIILSRKYQGST